MIPTYVIAHVIGGNGKEITCFDCGLTSGNGNDNGRYSSDCHKSHDEKGKEASLSPELFTESSTLDPFFDWS
jgi:hypothetical protein